MNNSLKKIRVRNIGYNPYAKTNIVVQNKINYIPKVSVIIPVYNAKEYLRECLDSVVNQTLKEIEILCVDDGSTDGSLDILKEYAYKDNRITLLSQKRLYAGEARNAGLAVAKGDYIHFLDSDDWVNLDTYEKLHNEIILNNTEFIKFRSFSFDNQSRKIVNSYFTNMGGVNSNYFRKKLYLNRDYKILVNISDTPWSGLYNARFLKKNGIKFDNSLCGNDTTFFYRCLCCCKNLFLISDRYVYYRINNPKSLMGIRCFNFNCQINQYFNILNIIKNTFQDFMDVTKKHLIQAIFYRYDSYVNDSNLSYAVKRKIKDEMINFLQKIGREDLPLEYVNYYDVLKSKISVSVIVPVYNAEKHLRECLDSVINQTLKNIEIICVNDGSTDSSLEILKKYAQKDSRFVIIEQKNAGSATARNKAIKIAKGNYVGFIDSDDYIDKDYYENLLLSAMRNNADITATSSCKLFKGEKIISVKNMGLTNKLISSEDDKGNIIVSTGVSWNKIYNTDFLRRNNLYFLEIKNAAEDNYFTDTAVISANKISVVDNVTYYYRVSENSQTQVLKDNKQFSMIEVYKRIDDFITKANILNYSKKKFLEIMNIRKRVDFYHFINTMDKQFIEEFRKLFIKAFPQFKDTLKEVIISLTSYPKRINTVNQTIESLLNQSMKADKIILWLAPEEFPNKEADLPQDLLNLKSRGLIIDWYHNICSYKKLIPTLKKYPDSIIVTADDDVIYDINWLKKLYDSYLKKTNEIQCHRAHKIYLQGKKILPYKKWIWVNHLNPGQSGFNIFFTGVGGVLYPSHSLDKRVLEEDKFKRLCPFGDDIWFWGHAVLNGTKINFISDAFVSPKIIHGTQESALWYKNVEYRNDLQINAILKEYPQILKCLVNKNRKFLLKYYLVTFLYRVLINVLKLIRTKSL